MFTSLDYNSELQLSVGGANQIGDLKVGATLIYNVTWPLDDSESLFLSLLDPVP